ncbi:MAG: DUF1810 domain-containing protein [Woeseiaceae bacterium]|nr:DUF1810 domain-containing protein [Woeseiaceae bacterium]
MTDDTFNLERFVEAQEAVYESVLEELRRGRKTSHWMWYVFPQIVGLGYSEMAQRYAISSIDEAQAYCVHPVLGPRLNECMQILLAVDGTSAEEIFGNIDALKLRSCATLFFAASGGEPLFDAVLDRYFDGVPDLKTLTALRS